MPTRTQKVQKYLFASTVALQALLSTSEVGFLFAQDTTAAPANSASEPIPDAQNAATTPNNVNPVQSTAPSEPLNRIAAAIKQVNRALELKISEIIARHIPVREFQVIVKVEASEIPANELPYFPGVSGTASDSSQTDPAITAINVTILLSSRFGTETTDALSKILENKLSDLVGNGLKISFETLTIKTESNHDEIQKRLERAEADLRNATTNSQTIERERNDTKNELIATKTTLETQKTTFENQLKLEQEKAKELAERTKQLEDRQETIRHFTQSGVWIVFAILIGICLIFASKLFATAIKAVGIGISTIAGSLETLANSLSEKNQTKESDNRQASDETPSATAVSGVAGTTATIETLRARVVELNIELLAAINDTNDNILVKYLSHLLGHPDTVDLAVATMEVLGKDKANQIFYRLGRTYQDQVIQFLNHGRYRKNKIELMVEGGEQLLTRLMGENLKVSRGILTPEVAELILQLSVSDLVDVANTLDTDHKLRVFFYLEPTKLAEFLTLLGKIFPNELETVADSLHRIAEFEKRVDLDPFIILTMKQRLEANQQDHMEPYLKYYQNVLETMDESLAESLMHKISQSDDRLRKHLRAHIVTFNTYFELPEDYQRELIEGLGNKAIGTLIAGIEPHQGEIILKLVEERRHDLIQEEIDSMASLPKREIRDNFDKVKATILARMKILSKSGVLPDRSTRAPEQPSAPAAA